MLVKRIFFMLVLLLGLTTRLVMAEEQATPLQPQQVSLDIKGMSCALCPAIIRKKLESMPGVIEAKVNFDTKMAWVKYDVNKVNLQDLINAVIDIGYKASLHTKNNND